MITDPRLSDAWTQIDRLVDAGKKLTQRNRELIAAAERITKTEGPAQFNAIDALRIAIAKAKEDRDD